VQKTYNIFTVMFDAATPRNPREYPHILYRPTSYLQKLELLVYIFATDSMGLYLLLFTQLSFVSKTADTKTEFDPDPIHSRSF